MAIFWKEHGKLPGGHIQGDMGGRRCAEQDVLFRIVGLGYRGQRRQRHPENPLPPGHDELYVGIAAVCFKFELISGARWIGGHHGEEFLPFEIVATQRGIWADRFQVVEGFFKAGSKRCVPVPLTEIVQNHAVVIGFGVVQVKELESMKSG